MIRVILWDIDGTLVHTGHAGEIALVNAMAFLFGIETSLHDVDYKGRTDRQIARNLLAKHGLPINDNTERTFVEAYLAELALQLPQRQGHIYPGVREALLALDAREDTHNALLTGNMQRGAQLKLERYNLWHYFSFGAFADHSRHRPDLGAHALQLARNRFGPDFAPNQLIVVGDTPHDVDCGRSVGARTIAVATGSFTVNDLCATGADAVFPNLSELQPFLEAIFAA